MRQRSVALLLVLSGCRTSATEPPAEVAVVEEPTVPPTVVDIAAHGDSTCALRSDGVVACWGLFGDERNAWATPVQIAGVESATAIAVGDGFACALAEGVVSCWGRNELRQLGGVRATTPRMTAETVPRVDDTTAIAAWGASACARTPTGDRCWGQPNVDGKHPALDAFGDPEIPCTVGATVECDPAYLWTWERSEYEMERLESAITKGAATLGPTEKLAMGEIHICALGRDGHVRCWGDSTRGQFGDGRSALSPTPVRVPLEGVTDFGGGYWRACVVAQGQVSCSYREGHVYAAVPDANPAATGFLHGRLGRAAYVNASAGIGEITDRSGIVSIDATPPGPVADVIGGEPYAPNVLLADGTVALYDWGDPYEGPQTYRRVEGIVGAVEAERNCARLRSGQIQCWTVERSEAGNRAIAQPPLASISGAIALATDGHVACGVLGNGSVRCEGDVLDGLHPPLSLAERDDIAGLDLAGCAWTRDGAVECWRSPDATADRPLVPLALPGPAKRVDGNGYTGCALLEDDSLHCWGEIENGMTGDGKPLQSGTPIDITEAIVTAPVAPWLGRAPRRLPYPPPPKIPRPRPDIPPGPDDEDYEYDGTWDSLELDDTQSEYIPTGELRDSLAQQDIEVFCFFGREDDARPDGCHALFGLSSASAATFEALDQVPGLVDVIVNGRGPAPLGAGLAHHPSLRRVELHGVDNPLSAIEGLPGLTDLDLSRCTLTDITALGELRELRKLDLSFTQVSDISSLGGLEHLEELQLSYTLVRDIAVVANLAHLRSLWVDQPATLEPLREHPSLKLLVIEKGAEHLDLEPLRTIPSLRELSIETSGRVDLKDLVHLSGLENLRLEGVTLGRDELVALRLALPKARIRWRPASQ